jgi:16S rRNA (uracil1498-N3)-methyltransferase
LVNPFFMDMQLYYHPDLSIDTFDLTEEESVHLKVLRLQIDEQISITDGRGTLAIVAIEQNKRKQWTVRVLKREYTNATRHSMELVISPLKNNERIEWLLEKATEMGITAFTILPCTRSERKTVNEERLRKVMISAAKQSQHLHFPELRVVKTFSDYITEKTGVEKCIAFCGEKTIPIHDSISVGKPLRILIGPEGDFTDEEVALAIQQGYQSVSLGESRLRSETAGLYAVAAFKFLNRL